jgi:hypothetical protein
MEISLLCGVRVMLCIVDKNDKNVLFMSEDSDPEGFVEKFVTKNIKKETYVSNKNVNCLLIIVRRHFYI